MEQPTEQKATNSWKYAFIALVVVVVLAGVILWVNSSSGSVTGNVVKGDSVTVPSAKVLIDDDPVLGDANAPVTIVQFTDWQCPFCRKFESETFDQIKQNYIDTGKVKFVTRDFPLESIHPGALPAALAAECVNDLGGSDGYYAFKELVNDEQNTRDSGSPAGPVTKTITFTNDDLVAWAQTLGFDIQSCLDDQTYLSEVRDDLAGGQAAGVSGTPAFFIINKKGTATLLSGAQPYTAFKSALDVALK